MATALVTGTSGCGSESGDLGTAEAALVPPPPANQNIGMYDQTFNQFGVVDCFGCHATQAPACTDPNVSCSQISARHHQILDPTSPSYDASYTCGSCHPTVLNTTTGLYEMKVVLNCGDCHQNSPHHTSAQATAANCKACHSNVVTNIADAKTIPTYAPSMVTPATGCRVWTDTTHTVCKAGGCAACHSASTNVTPPISDNKTLHHGTGLGVSPNPTTQCGWCHKITVTGGVPSAALDIRSCEQCHPFSQLHNIQFNYNATQGQAGYGHMGADQDCWGCHGWFAKYTDSAPGAGATIPTINSVMPTVFRTGVATNLVVTGQSLTNSYTYPDGSVQTFNPEVVMQQGDIVGNVVGTPLVLQPSSFTQSELTVAVPSNIGVGIWQVRVVKARGTAQEKVSNRIDVTVQPQVAITAAALSCVNGATTVTVDGNGFGPQPPSTALMTGLFAGAERCTVSSWTTTRIVGACNTAVPGSTIKVIGAFNTAAPATAPATGTGCDGGITPPPPAAPAAVITATSSKVAACTTPGCSTLTLRYVKGVSATLDGRPSTNEASYQWTITGPRSSSSTASVYTVKFSARGTYTATLVVSDAAGQKSAPAQMNIVVQ